MSRRPRGRDSNRWLIPALALFVVLPVGGAIAQAVLGGDNETAVDRLRRDRSGSVSLGRPAAPMLPENTPVSYVIGYQVIETASDRPLLTNEVVEVRRPFDARWISREGTIVGKGKTRGERVSSLTRLATKSVDGKWALFEIPPALATTDVRFGAALDQALEDGDIQPREQRRIAGRECQVFRAGSSLQAGLLTRYEPGSPTFADVCVDRDGLLLEEVWSIDGKRVQRRLAVEVRVDVTLPDAIFAIPDDAQSIPLKDGGGAARRVDLSERPPGAFRVLPQEATPEGFALLGRWAVVSPRLEVMRDPTNPGQADSSSSVVDVYTRGPDVLVIDRGTSTGRGSLPESDTARPVDLGALGQGFAITDFRMNEVRAVGSTDFTRVYGTLPIPLLVEAAQALTIVPGGALQVEGDEGAGGSEAPGNALGSMRRAPASSRVRLAS